MNRKLFGKIVTFVLCLVVTASVYTMKNEQEVAASFVRYTKCSANVREEATTNSDIVVNLKKNRKLVCYGTVNENWYKIKYDGKYAYISKKMTKKKKGVTGQDVVKYAKKFVGNPYVYGGSSLTRGTDCSGFTMSVYRHFGYKLPHSSSSQASCGKRVSWKNKQPGDLICYYGHVAIYIGNNKIVHASNPSTGIKISKNAAYRDVRCVRRILK